MDVWNEILVKVLIPAIIGIVTMVVTKLLYSFSKWLDSKIPTDAEAIHALKNEVLKDAIGIVEATTQEMGLEAVKAANDGKLPGEVAEQALNASLEKLKNMSKVELEELRRSGIDAEGLAKDVIHTALSIVKKTSLPTSSSIGSDPISEAIRKGHQ